MLVELVVVARLLVVNLAVIELARVSKLREPLFSRLQRGRVFLAILTITLTYACIWRQTLGFDRGEDGLIVEDIQGVGWQLDVVGQRFR